MSSHAPSLFTTAAMEGFRRLRRRVHGTPLYTLRPTGPPPDMLATIPPSFTKGAGSRALDIYGGIFDLGGERHHLAPGQTFVRDAAPQASDAWHAQLHAFGWLADLYAADTPIARNNAAALILDWLGLWERNFPPIVWRGDVVADRLLAWLRFADTMMAQNADSQAKRLRKAMLRHIRFLNHNASSTRDGLPRLKAHLGLAIALAAMGRGKALQRALDGVDGELRRQILPDGGHISRNPTAIVILLEHCVTLRDTLQAIGHPLPQTLVSRIAAMVMALRFFRLGPLDGHHGLGQFNGTGCVDGALVEALLRHEGASGEPPVALPQSGYDRLSARRTVLLMDTGRCTRPSVAPAATASTLSFELASRGAVFIANCGMPPAAMGDLAPYARATAAHSTATLADASSSHFHETRWWNARLLANVPGALAQPPAHVKRARRDDAVQASHDGYAATHGVIHERSLRLDESGNAIDGIDRFPRTENARADALPLAIRFHIPPEIQISRLNSGHSVLLVAPGGETWTFTCVDAPFVLEESIHFARPSPRRCQQIAIHATLGADGQPLEIRWALRRKVSAGGKGAQTSRAETPKVETTADLFALAGARDTEGGA